MVLLVMVQYCAFNKCKSKSTDGILLFKIPKNIESQLEWQKFIKNSGKKILEKIHELRLCEYHFVTADINRQWNPPRLFANAVPVFKDNRVNFIKM